jgi:hypothetical protein
MRRNGRDAPIPDLPAVASERGNSTRTCRPPPMRHRPHGDPKSTFRGDWVSSRTRCSAAYQKGRSYKLSPHDAPRNRGLS